MDKSRALTRSLVALTVIGNSIIFSMFGPGERWRLDHMVEESFPVMLIFTFVVWVGSFFVGWIIRGWHQDNDPEGYAAWENAVRKDAEGPTKSQSPTKPQAQGVPAGLQGHAIDWSKYLKD